jgi:glutathione S-transferase
MTPPDLERCGILPGLAYSRAVLRAGSMSETYQLFHSETCGYCHQVRRFLSGAGIEIPLRDIQRDRSALEELVAGGGRATVPCLRIERAGNAEWLYESLDIIDYLAARHRQTMQVEQE